MIRLALISCVAALPAVAADLSVRVNGGIPETGQVLAALFASESGWMKTPVVEQIMPIGHDGGAQILFSNLTPGSYGLSIIYDEDADGELDLNILGIPKEGFGFSNNARASFGPPKWRKVRFEVSDPSTSINVRLDRAD